MDIYTVSFFGHRHIDNFSQTEKALEATVRHLIETHQYVDFLVGRNGDFDALVSAVIRRTKNNYRSDNSSHILVLPYFTREYLQNKEAFELYYDEIEICEKSASAHFKAAFKLRNAEMINRSDIVICSVDHPEGGAYEALRYAENIGKNVLNLANKAL